MSKPMKPDDPAYWMLHDGFETKPNPNIYDPNCYICRDHEFAQMGLPLCRPCIICGAHVAADDCICNNGHDQPMDPLEEIAIRKQHGLEISEKLKKQAEQMLKFADEEK